MSLVFPDNCWENISTLASFDPYIMCNNLCFNFWSLLWVSATVDIVSLKQYPFLPISNILSQPFLPKRCSVLLTNSLPYIG